MSQITIQRLNPMHAEAYRAMCWRRMNTTLMIFYLIPARAGIFSPKLLSKQLNSCSIVV